MSGDRIAIFAPNFSSPTTAEMGIDHYTAGTIPPLMPPSLLLTDEPSDRSRLLTHDPIDTYWFQRFTGGDFLSSSRTVQGLGLVNVATLTRFGYYRFVGGLLGSDIPFAGRIVRLAPTAITASSNVTGALSDVNENPRSPDGDSIVPTIPADPWSATFSFPTPSASLATGAYKQAFVVWATRMNGGTTQRPVLKAELLEGGVSRGEIATKVVAGKDSGQTLIFRWDATLLSDITGAGVEVRLTSSAFDDVNVELGALAWDYETAVDVGWAIDSGWRVSPFDTLSARWGGTGADEMGQAPVKNLSYSGFTPSPVNAWMVMISDDQADTSYTYAADLMVAPGRVKEPDGYTQAGVAVVSAVFSPGVGSLNFDKGPLVSARTSSSLTYTLGGQAVGSRRRQRRAMPVAFAQLTEAEGLDLFDRLDWRRGKELPVLVAKFPEDNKPHTTLWATLEDMPGLSIPSAHGKTAWSGLFVEKL